MTKSCKEYAYVVCNEPGAFLNARNGRWEESLKPKHVYHSLDKATRVAKSYNGLVKNIEITLKVCSEDE